MELARKRLAFENITLLLGAPSLLATHMKALMRRAKKPGDTKSSNARISE